MDAATFYESVFILVAGILLLGGLCFWSLLRALRRSRPPTDLFAPSGSQPSVLDIDTGLYSPWYFYDQLGDYLHRAQSPILEHKELLLIRLPEFDPLIRSFGFARVDMIIHSIADCLKAWVNTPEISMASYLGQGTFAFFADPGFAPDLLKQLDKPHGGFQVRLVAGSAYWPAQGRSPGRLMRHAEMALLMSQAQHKRWLAYESEMEPGHLDLDIISCFAEGKVQGLSAVFQPQLNIHTGRIESAEALVRWNSSRFGDVSPRVFIPLLETAGLMEQVTGLMINKAIQLAADLRRQHITCAVGVNISLKDMMQTPLVRLIRESLDRHQGHASDLKLEITENFLTDNDSQIFKKILHQLNELGVAIALDNVGIGNLSLSILSQFPLAAIHINRHLVGDMLINPEHKKLVHCAIAMAREMETNILAEGVEDDKTLQRLKAGGCDYAQGSVIAHPMDETRFIEFMRTHGEKGFDLK